MAMSFLVTLLLLVSPLWSQSQLELDQYVEMFSLKPLPAASPKREALYQLGLRLFYDKRLSGKENISCGSCHSLSGFSSDTLPLAVGEGAEGLGKSRHQSQGTIIPRHTPALYNIGLPGVTSYFWDGRISTHPQGGWLTPEEGLNGPQPSLKKIAETFDSLLAVQAIFPITSPEEMLGQGSSLSRVEAWVATMDRILNGQMGASYRRFFREAYPGVSEFNIAHIGNALAELQRHHFLANNTLWDLYLRGSKNILSTRMKRGAEVFFGKGSCFNCHKGEHLSTFGFQNIGIPQIGPGLYLSDDRGRFEVTQNSNHLYRFRVAPLRNVGLTAPYMHSGVFSTMWEVIDHYDHPMRSLHHFTWNPRHARYRENLVLDSRRETNQTRASTLASNLPRHLGLSPEEKADLYCFLMVALTDIKFQANLLQSGVMDQVSDCRPRLTN
jgi:cytochrome c peroxidase